MSKAKSLVLVTVDCLRADHTGFLGYTRPTTPFLDRLAMDSLVFPRAIVTGSPTYYSLPGILASRFPLALGREVVGIAPGEPTLATVLQQAGYRTAAYNAGNPYLLQRFGYAQGFEVFQDFLSEASPQPDDSAARARTRFNQRIADLAHKISPLGRLYDELYFQYCQRIAAPKNPSWDDLRPFPAADVLVDQACTWLRSIGNEPFFLWLHFMDPHTPFYPPAAALEAMGDRHLRPERARYLNANWYRGDVGVERWRKYRDEIVRLYDAGIRWVDMQVARLVEELRASSRWDSCAFVLTADHGEEFLERGGRFHPHSGYQEILHVPLVLRVPGTPARRLADTPFSLIHLAPTVLDVIGMDAPLEFEGGSLWPAVQAGAGWETAISEGVRTCSNPMDVQQRLGARLLVVQDRKFKLLLHFDNGREDLFDLENDPQESRPLAPEKDKKARARLMRIALNHLERRPSQRRRESAMRARVRQIGLEWEHSKMQPEMPAS